MEPDDEARAVMLETLIQVQEVLTKRKIERREYMEILGAVRKAIAMGEDRWADGHYRVNPLPRLKPRKP